MESTDISDRVQGCGGSLTMYSPDQIAALFILDLHPSRIGIQSKLTNPFRTAVTKCTHHVEFEIPTKEIFHSTKAMPKMWTSPPTLPHHTQPETHPITKLSEVWTRSLDRSLLRLLGVKAAIQGLKHILPKRSGDLGNLIHKGSTFGFRCHDRDIGIDKRSVLINWIAVRTPDNKVRTRNPHLQRVPTENIWIQKPDANRTNLIIPDEQIQNLTLISVGSDGSGRKVRTSVQSGSTTVQTILMNLNNHLEDNTDITITAKSDKLPSRHHFTARLN